MSSSIVVTGGCGFIGTRLVRRLLAAGHEVRIVDKRAYGPYADLCTVCDLLDPAGLQRAFAGAQVIYHLAAEHRDDVRPLQLYEEVNVQGTRNVRAAAEALGIKQIIFTSSVAVYGFAPHEMNETAEPRPFNEYGRTKLEAEKVLREWAEQGSQRALVLIRPAAVFGEGNRANVYNFLRGVAKKSFVMVGRGNNKKSIAYVDNVAAFLEFGLRFGGGVHLFNYADKPDLDMNNLVRLVRSKLGQPTKVRLRLPYYLGYTLGCAFDGLAFVTRRNFPISAVRVRKFCENSQFSAAKALATEFRPPFTLDQGLDRVLQAEFGRGTDERTPAPVAAQVEDRKLVKQA